MFGASLVFFMQVGFALLEVGSVSIRNTKNTLFKNLLDVCCGAVSFYLFGYGFLYGAGAGGFVGVEHFALSSSEFDVRDASIAAQTATAAKSHAKFVFAFSFAATSATIVSGAVAERFLFKAYALYTSAITGALYPIVAHWVWSDDGWASPLRPRGSRLFGSGAVDYAGSAVVHVTGGLAALIACVVVGPRVGRFNAGIPMELPMQSPVVQTAGTMFLWFGWYGFNCVAVGTLEHGGAFISAKAGVSTTLAAAAGGGAVMLADAYVWPKKIEPRRMNNGILCGLVAVSGSAGLVPSWASLVIGFVAGFVYVSASYALLVWHVDDVVDAAPIHLFGGIWGILAPALFVNEREYVMRYGSPTDKESGGVCGVFMGCAGGGSILGANVVFLLALVAFIGTGSFCALRGIKMVLGSLRVRVNDEMKGMDASQHGGRSYTEFQTTVFTFKTPGGGEHSMEMRVRAGDAAKFAMALSEVMENSSNGSDREGSSHSNAVLGRTSGVSSNARMVFQSEDPLGDVVVVGGGGGSARFPSRGSGINGGKAAWSDSGGVTTSFDSVVIGDGNVAYANHSVTLPSPSLARGVLPPLSGTGGSTPNVARRGDGENAVVALTAVDEDPGSGRSSPALGMTRDGEPFDPFAEANRT